MLERLLSVSPLLAFAASQKTKGMGQCRPTDPGTAAKLLPLTTYPSLLTPYYSPLTTYPLLLTPYYSPLTTYPPYSVLLTTDPGTAAHLRISELELATDKGQ